MYGYVEFYFEQCVFGAESKELDSSPAGASTIPADTDDR